MASTKQRQTGIGLTCKLSRRKSAIACKSVQSNAKEMLLKSDEKRTTDVRRLSKKKNTKKGNLVIHTCLL